MQGSTGPCDVRQSIEGAYLVKPGLLLGHAMDCALRSGQGVHDFKGSIVGRSLQISTLEQGHCLLKATVSLVRCHCGPCGQDVAFLLFGNLQLAAQGFYGISYSARVCTQIEEAADGHVARCASKRIEEEDLHSSIILLEVLNNKLVFELHRQPNE